MILIFQTSETVLSTKLSNFNSFLDLWNNIIIEVMSWCFCWHITRSRAEIRKHQRIFFFFYLYDHLDSRQRGGNVLGVGRSHRDGYTTGVQAAVKCHDEVDTWRAGGRKMEDKGRERWEKTGGSREEEDSLKLKQTVTHLHPRRQGDEAWSDRLSGRLIECCSSCRGIGPAWLSLCRRAGRVEPCVGGKLQISALIFTDGVSIFRLAAWLSRSESCRCRHRALTEYLFSS